MSKDSISYNDILEKTTVFLDKVFEDIDKEIMYTVKKIEEYLVDSIIDDEYDVKMRRTRFREIPGYMFDSLEEEIKEYVTKAKATQEKLIESYNVFNYLIQNEKCEKKSIMYIDHIQFMIKDLYHHNEAMINLNNAYVKIEKIIKNEEN